MCSNAWTAQSAAETSKTLSPEEERAVVITMDNDIETPRAMGGLAYPPARAAVSTVSACRYVGVSPGLTRGDLYRGASGVRQHLWQHHYIYFVHDSLGRHICQWRANNGKTCLERISDLDNLASHIASVHLRLIAQRCPICAGEFARMDSVLRHRKKCT